MKLNLKTNFLKVVRTNLTLFGHIYITHTTIVLFPHLRHFFFFMQHQVKLEKYQLRKSIEQFVLNILFDS